MKWVHLTEQEFLLEKEFLEQQFFEDLLVVRWVEVVDWVSDDRFIDWDGGNIGDGQEDEQCLWKVKRKLENLLISWLSFLWRSRSRPMTFSWAKYQVQPNDERWLIICLCVEQIVQLALIEIIHCFSHCSCRV